MEYWESCWLLRRVVRFEAGVFVRAVAERPVARLAAAAKIKRIEGALDIFLAVDILELGAAGDFVRPSLSALTVTAMFCLLADDSS